MIAPLIIIILELVAMRKSIMYNYSFVLICFYELVCGFTLHI